MRTEGALILEDIVEAALIEEAREVFVQRYDRCLDGRKLMTRLRSETGALMITVDLDRHSTGLNYLRIRGCFPF